MTGRTEHAGACRGVVYDVIGPAGAGGGALSGQLFQCVGLASASSHAWARPGERYKKNPRVAAVGEEKRIERQ